VQATDRVKAIAMYVNERKREFDSLAAISDLAPRLQGFDAAKPGLHFVREDAFMQVVWLAVIAGVDTTSGRCCQRKAKLCCYYSPTCWW
jgi:hypothetical protein